MKLYTYFRSSASYRVRIALNLKAAPHTLAAVNLFKGEQRNEAYAAENPQKLVPALNHDGLILSQSLAIIDYIDAIHPEPPIYPDAPEERALVQSMALIIGCEIHPLDNLRVLKYLKNELTQPQDAVDTWYRHWITEGFAALEEIVARHGGDAFCYGDSPTLADIFLVPQMYNARRFETDLSAFPRLVAIDKHLQTLKPFLDAVPENQPDAA